MFFYFLYNASIFVEKVKKSWTQFKITQNKHSMVCVGRVGGRRQSGYARCCWLAFSASREVLLFRVIVGHENAALVNFFFSVPILFPVFRLPILSTHEVNWSHKQTGSLQSKAQNFDKTVIHSCHPTPILLNLNISLRLVDEASLNSIWGGATLITTGYC